MGMIRIAIQVSSTGSGAEVYISKGYGSYVSGLAKDMAPRRTGSFPAIS